MPKFKFSWSNLPQSLLSDLCRDLIGPYNHDEGPAAALQAEYGARPTEEFIRDAWPTLRASWLTTAKEPRKLIVQALQESLGEKGLVKGGRAQLTYLKDLRNSATLRKIVWRELVAAGEVEQGPRDRVAALLSPLDLIRRWSALVGEGPMTIGKGLAIDRTQVPDDVAAALDEIGQFALTGAPLMVTPE